MVVVGLATDYCVGRTTIDAQGLGIPATILLDVSRGVANQSIQVYIIHNTHHTIRLFLWSTEILKFRVCLFLICWYLDKILDISLYKKADCILEIPRPGFLC